MEMYAVSIGPVTIFICLGGSHASNKPHNQEHTCEVAQPLSLSQHYCHCFPMMTSKKDNLGTREGLPSASTLPELEGMRCHGMEWDNVCAVLAASGPCDRGLETADRGETINKLYNCIHPVAGNQLFLTLLLVISCSSGSPIIIIK